LHQQLSEELQDRLSPSTTASPAAFSKPFGQKQDENGAWPVQGTVINLLLLHKDAAGRIYARDKRIAARFRAYFTTETIGLVPSTDSGVAHHRGGSDTAIVENPFT